jgi:NAD(P)-dependent dehydrogenase (short-subunit alcohol dehydrogenase family)
MMTTATDTTALQGRVAIVTGAAGGIGAAIAARLARDGARVVVADLDAGRAEAAAAQLAAQDAAGEAAGQGCDVGDEAQVERCVAYAVQRFGGLDIVVNNAGLMTFKTLAEWSADDWLKVLRVDLLGAAFFTRQAFLHMGEKGGAIVNVASVHALMTSPNVAPYAAAKAALLSLTRSASIEGRARAIRANAVLPGAIDTPMLWNNPNLASGAETIDKRDVGSPEDIAAAVAYLAGDEARFVTGTTLVVDGGRLARL